MALPNRKDVASELTWDLTPLYPNDEAWAKDLTVLKQLVTDLAADFDGHLTTTAQILAGLTALEKVEQKHLWSSIMLSYIKQAIWLIHIMIIYWNKPNKL